MYRYRIGTSSPMTQKKEIWKPAAIPINTPAPINVFTF